MKKVEKYSLVVILIVLVIIAIIIGIVKFVGTKKQVNTSKIEEVVAKEETPESLVVEVEEVVEEQPEQSIEEIPEEEETEVKQPTEKEKKDSKAPYYIKINYSQNVVTIYEKDSEGNYTKPIKAMVCSCGSATPTSGTYKISYKYRWLSLFGGVHGQYCTRIVGHILFHSVPYLENGNPGSLEYWEYDKLGTTASAGCVRLTVQDAQWIYTNCASGTMVEFYSDSNPGPLGKPSAQKISGDEEVRGWDPTDPDENNPWRTYVRQKTTPGQVEEQPVNPEQPNIPIKEPEEPDMPVVPEIPEEPEEPIDPEQIPDESEEEEKEEEKKDENESEEKDNTTNQETKTDLTKKDGETTEL